MPGNPLNITLPTVGVTVGPDYATSINLALQTIITDVEAKITPDEISINASLDFKPGATAYGAINLDRVNFDAKSSLPSITTVSESLFVYDNELYFQDGTGTNVAITAAGTVSAAAGNITSTGSPTYASLANGLQWSGGDLEYIFTDNGTNTYAGLVFLDAQFRNGVNSMTMESAVTTDYTITWPTAAPSGTELVQVDSAGAVSFSSTVVDPTTFTGLLTGSAGLEAAANQDVTVSGTGRHRHGLRSVSLAAAGGMSSGSGGLGSSHNEWALNSGTLDFYWAVPLETGKTIDSVAVQYYAATSDIRLVSLFSKTTANALAPSSIAGDSSNTSTGTTSTLVSGINHVVAAGEALTVAIAFQGASTSHRVALCTIFYSD